MKVHRVRFAGCILHNMLSAAAAPHSKAQNTIGQRGASNATTTAAKQHPRAIHAPGLCCRSHFGDTPKRGTCTRTTHHTLGARPAISKQQQQQHIPIWLPIAQAKATNPKKMFMGHGGRTSCVLTHKNRDGGATGSKPETRTHHHTNQLKKIAHSTTTNRSCRNASRGALCKLCTAPVPANSCSPPEQPTHEY